MSSSSIDPLPKIAAPAAPGAKPAAPSAPRDAADEFENYLRQATSTNSAPEKPRETASDIASDKQLSVSGHDQGATTPSDDESTEAPVVEQTETNTADLVDEAPVDEVILSIAASAIATTAPAEASTEVDVAVQKSLIEPVLITGQTEQSAGENHLPSNQLAAEIDPEVTAIEGSTVGEATKILGPEDERVKQTVVHSTGIIEAVGQFAAIPQAELGQAAAAQQVVLEVQTDTRKNEKAEHGEQSEAKAGEDGKSSAHERHLGISPGAIAESVEVTTVGDQTSETNSKTSVDAPAPTPAVNTQVNSQGVTQSVHSHSEAIVTRGESKPQTPTIDRARFVQRVANAFRSAQQNDGQIQLRLSPPELGSLRIEIAVRNGVLAANLEVETADARRVLLDNLPALRQRLAEQEIRIEKFEVDIRREGGQQEGQANAREQQSEHQSSRATAQNRISTSQTAEALAARVLRIPLTGIDAGLDVRI